MTTTKPDAPASKLPRLPWRKLIDRNSEDFTVDDMPDDPRDPAKKRDLTVKVVRVDLFGKVKSVQGDKTKESRCPKLYFAGIDKPLGVKVTIAKQITRVTGSKFPADWEGALLTLYVLEDEMCFGTPTDVVRVREVRPTEAQWAACQKGYKAPPFSLEIALKAIADARSTDELKTWKANLKIPKTTPPEDVERLRAAYASAEAELTESEKGEQPYDPAEHADDQVAL